MLRRLNRTKVKSLKSAFQLFNRNVTVVDGSGLNDTRSHRMHVDVQRFKIRQNRSGVRFALTSGAIARSKLRVGFAQDYGHTLRSQCPRHLQSLNCSPLF